MHLYLLDDIHATFTVNHIYSESSPAKASCPTNTVKVRLVVGISCHVHWEVKVHHERHLLDIDTWTETKTRSEAFMITWRLIVKLSNRLTSGANVCGHKHFFLAVTKTIDNSSPLLHGHFPTQQRHLVAFFSHLCSQPRCHPASLNEKKQNIIVFPTVNISS